MKKYAKRLTIISLVLLMLLSLVGCGSDGKDSSNSIQEIRNAEIGSVVKFGKYRSSDKSDKKKDIEWLVMDKNQDGVLLISKYALDCIPYNRDDKDVTWETCYLRKWLNDDFYNDAFDDNEKQAILEVKVEAHENSEWSDEVDSGNDTYDKIYVLSSQEAHKYFLVEDGKTEDGRTIYMSTEFNKCEPNDLAKSKGAMDESTLDASYRGAWWLRTPGLAQNMASYCNYDGSINQWGKDVYLSYLSVRPVLWIKY